MGVAAASRQLGQVQVAVFEELAISHSNPPETLHHYTTPEGLLGIFQSSALFLSDARFVNDRIEISYGRRVFNDRLRKYVEDSDSERVKRVWDHFNADAERRASQPPLYEHFYVTSFCTDGNLLSQWRAYGATANGGCSIGFKTSQLIERAIVGADNPRARLPIVTLQQVLYDPDLQNAFVDRMLARVFGVLKDDDHPSAPQYLAGALHAFVKNATTSCIKASIFREEQEWRLVCPFKAGAEYRLQKGRIVPYLRCTFQPMGTSAFENRLPISTIHIGPSHNSELLEISTRELLHSYGFEADYDLRIVASEIPLRF